MLRRIRLHYDNGTASPWMRLENEMYENQRELHEAWARHHYPNTAGSKERNGTSELAAEKIEKSGKAAALRERVLDAFWINEWSIGPFTADEIADKLGESILNVRPRVSELFKQGLLEKTGIRRNNAQGSSCAVFRLVQS